MDQCSLCKANWSEGQFSSGCKECGGFALTRGCPHCGGLCGAIWVRNVGMSNTLGEAYYSGGCKIQANNSTEGKSSENI